jgi:hypothetical protein
LLEVRAQSDWSAKMEILSNVAERYDPLVLSLEDRTCLLSDTALLRGDLPAK